MTGDIIGGFAFSSLQIGSQVEDAFRAIGGESLQVSTGMTPVIKPEASLWYDINQTFGISADIGYIVARPRITVSSSVGRESGRFTRTRSP